MDIEQKIITPILPILKSYDLKYDSSPKAQQYAYDTHSLDDNFENYPAAIYEPSENYFETYDGYGNKKYISGGNQMKSRLRKLNKQAIAAEERAYQKNDGAEYSRKFHEDRKIYQPQEDVRTTLPVSPVYRSQDSYSEYINGNHENKLRKELETGEPCKETNRILEYIKEYFPDDGMTFTDKK